MTMRTGLLMLAALAFLWAGTAAAKPQFVAGYCVEPGDHIDLNIKRLECDAEAEAADYTHGFLRPRVRKDLVTVVCPLGTEVYLCFGVRGSELPRP
jgi:hypothetical protein